MTASDRRVVGLIVNGFIAAVLIWLDVRSARYPTKGTR